MTMSREELAAFADGELDAVRTAEVAAAIAADATLQAQVDAHRALRAQLGAHFAPIHDALVPRKLSALLESQEDTVISFVAAKDRRDRRILRWSWIAAPALAASLALAVFLPRGGGAYADGALTQALDRQLVATQATDAETRILLSFRNKDGSVCRAFAGERQSGIACRDDEGWRQVLRRPGVPLRHDEYRMAGTPAADVLKRAQAMAAGPALDASEEHTAKSRGWR